MKGPNNRYDRSTVRLTATHQLLNSLTFGGNFSYINTRGDYVQKGSNTSGLLLGALRTPPDFNNLPFLDPTSGLQRSYRFPNPTAASITSSRGYDNPFFMLDNSGNRSELGRFLGNVTANWVPTAWLSVNETFGADNYTDSRARGTAADVVRRSRRQRHAISQSTTSRSTTTSRRRCRTRSARTSTRG